MLSIQNEELIMSRGTLVLIIVVVLLLFSGGYLYWR
jgi:hypothetical protein